MSLTWGASAARNPLLPLPLPVETLLDADAVLLTHTHFDHWDLTAQKLLPKRLPVFCQSADVFRLRRQGFAAACPVPRTLGLTALGIKFRSFPGRHGHGIIGALMGASSGFCLEAKGEPALCISGDTVWCPEFARTLAEQQPGVVVLYAGEARFNLGAPITLGSADVARVAQALPRAQLVAVHLDTINHCRESRRALAQAEAQSGFAPRIHIPRDGEILEFD